jgi:hypothetical protein
MAQVYNEILSEVEKLKQTKKDIYNAIQSQLGAGTEKIIDLDPDVPNYPEMPFENYDNVIGGIRHTPLQSWLSRILSVNGPTVIIPQETKSPIEEIEESTQWVRMEWPEYSSIKDTDWFVFINEEIDIGNYDWSSLYKPLAFITKIHSTKLDYKYDYYSYYKEYKTYSIEYICNEIKEILARGIGRTDPAIWDVTFSNWDDPIDIHNLADLYEERYKIKTIEDWNIGEDSGKALFSGEEILMEQDDNRQKPYLAEDILGEFRWTVKFTEKLDGEWTEEDPRPEYVFFTADPNNPEEIDRNDLAELVRAFIEDGITDIIDEEIKAFPPEYVVSYPDPIWNKVKDNGKPWKHDYINENFPIEESVYEDESLLLSQEYAELLKAKVLIYTGDKTVSSILSNLEEGQTSIEPDEDYSPIAELRADCIKEAYEKLNIEIPIRDDWENFEYEQLIA